MVNAAPAGQRRRIPQLDGLRALAVAGVLYGHVWAFGCRSTPLRVGPVDVNRLLAVFGTGVDLFFVISGFCMYLMYAGRITSFEWQSYGRFLVGRARRILPAYLAAILFAACVRMAEHGTFPWRNVVANALFLQLFVPNALDLNNVFWSLATEWHFYMVLPALIAVGDRVGYPRMLLGASLLSILYRALFAEPYSGEPIPLDFQLPARLCEFCLGVAVARAFVADVPLPAWLRGARGFLAGFAVMLVGRVLLTNQVAQLSPEIRVVARAVNVPILATGYAIMVWNVVSSESVFAWLLRTSPMQALGRISYSFYLWHWFPSLWIAGFMMRYYGGASFVPLTATVVATAVLWPVAALSYRLFEAPYFARRVPPSPPATA
jgi:peptidoglycan/LPS O-acetylase OafA/YrhL